MEKATLEAFVASLPILEQARIDALTRGLERFRWADPSDQELQAWGAGLRTEAPHFFAPAQHPGQPTPDLTPPAWLKSPEDRLGWWHAQQATVTKERRPWLTYQPTPAEQAELAALLLREGRPAHDTRWRAMRDAAQARAAG